MNTGTIIKQLRKEKGFSQGRFCEVIGISQTALSQIETGATQPHKFTLSKICEALETPKPILFFLSLEESDIPERKREIYRVLSPHIKGLMAEVFN